MFFDPTLSLFLVLVKQCEEAVGTGCSTYLSGITSSETCLAGFLVFVLGVVLFFCLLLLGIETAKGQISGSLMTHLG